MADKAKALVDAIQRYQKQAEQAGPKAERVAPAKTVGELRDRMGGTKAVAGALGVAQRTVERYIAREEGKGSAKHSQRGFGKNKAGESIAEKFEQTSKQQAKDENREHQKEAREARKQAGKDALKKLKSGAGAVVDGEQGPEGYEREGRVCKSAVSAPTMTDVIDAYEEGQELETAGEDDKAAAKYEQAAEAFEKGFGGKYAGHTDWKMLDVEIVFG